MSPVDISSDSARRLTLVAYVSFLPIGIANVLLGPMLPTLSTRWGLNYAQAGALFTAQYITSTIAVGLSGFVVSSLGFRFTLNAGLLMMSAGLALLFSGPEMIGILSIGIIGAGIGIAVPAANMMVAELNPDRRSATLNWLNFCWSTGAVACPFMVAAAVRNQHVPIFLRVVAVSALAVVIWIAFVPSPSDRTRKAAAKESKSASRVNLRSAPFLVLAAIFFVYVGTENGFGGWVASYAKSLGNLSPSLSLVMPSFFYAALTLGRLLAPFLLKKVDEIALVQVGLLLGCVGTGGLLLAHATPGVVASACAAGLGLSCVYPISISLLSKQFGSEAARIAGLMFVLSNIGGGLLPWIVGVWSNHSGTLKSGLLLPLLGCATMFGLYRWDWGQGKPGKEGPQ